MYAAPRSTPSPTILPPDPEGLINAAISRGVEVFKRAWAMLVVSSLIYFGASIPLMALVFAFNVMAQAAAPTAFPWDAARRAAPGAGALWTQFGASMAGSLVMVAYTVLVLNPIYAGVITAAANVSRGGAANWDDLWCGWRRYSAVVSAGLLAGAIGFVLSTLFNLCAVALLAFPNGGALLLIAPVELILAVLGIWISMRLFLATTRAADESRHPLGGLAAVRFAWNATRWKAFPLFICLLLGLLVAGLSVIACCVGVVLLGLPLFFGIVGAAYDEVVRISDARRVTLGDHAHQ